MFRRLLPWIQKHERGLSAFAMVAGFIVDNIFFERVDLWQTQAVFAAYTAVCFISIPLLHAIEARAARGIRRPRWRFALPLATQFSLGGFWSGFVVFYGRSAVFSASWPFLALLGLVLILSEVLHRYHDRLVFTSVLFFFALYSYAIFAVPIYVGSISTETFLVSAVVAIVAFGLFTSLLRLVGRERFSSDVWRIRLGALIVLLVINASYFFNVLPPLPLSARAEGVYHAVWRVPGEYLALAEKESWSVRYLGAAPTLHVAKGDPLFAYSAVFAPVRIETTITHHWQWYDRTKDAWIDEAAIPYQIVGGRDGGYRGYTTLPITLDGAWRVDVESADGRIIARMPFTVVFSATTPAQEPIVLP